MDVAANPERTLLHRAIYDYFQWCASSKPPTIRAITQAMIEATTALANNNQVSEKRNEEMDNVGTTTKLFHKARKERLQEAVEENRHATHGQATIATQNTIDSATTNNIGERSSNAAHTQPVEASTDMAWREKARRVMSVLEQEFPDILESPGGNLEAKPMSELEKRFTGYPLLEQRVRSLEHLSLQQQNQLPPHNNPPLPHSQRITNIARPDSASVPPLPNTPAMPLPVPNGANPAIEITGGPGPGAIAFNYAKESTETLNANTTDDSNHKKQQESTTTVDSTVADGTVPEPTTTKLKEQATEIKKIKTQLRRANNTIQELKRTTSSTNSVRPTKKARTTAKWDEEKEKAMAASVSFEDRFEELVHFQKGYGHCRVPCTSKENPGLARWVQTLRAAYKEKQKRGKRYYGQLTDERLKQLESIGFEWTIQAPKASWEKRFEELKAFKEEHGHCRVVRSYSKNRSLGEWCHRQRFLAHKNQLEEHKVKLLTDLGFEIWVRSKGKSWEEHFEMLLEFRRKHQHLQVPPPDSRTKMKQILRSTASSETGESNDGVIERDGLEKTDASSPMVDGEPGPLDTDTATEEYREEQAFRRWVVAQRDNYHLKYEKGIKSPLNKTRVKKLQSINFDWTREGGENDLRKMRTGLRHHRNDPEIWNRRFQELLEYKKRFGDCNIPKEWPENKSLGAWVATQRKMYKAVLAGERSSLTKERQLALESIGFAWILRPARTRPRILEIEGLQNTGNNTGPSTMF